MLSSALLWGSGSNCDILTMSLGFLARNGSLAATSAAVPSLMRPIIPAVVIKAQPNIPKPPYTSSPNGLTNYLPQETFLNTKATSGLCSKCTLACNIRTRQISKITYCILGLGITFRFQHIKLNHTVRRPRSPLTLCLWLRLATVTNSLGLGPFSLFIKL